MLAYYQKLFTYDRWANEQFLEAMLREPPPTRALQLLAHIIAAENLWQSRLMRRPAPVPVWPAWSLEDCRQHVEKLPDLWREFWSRGAQLEESIRYTNSKGGESANRSHCVRPLSLTLSPLRRGEGNRMVPVSTAHLSVHSPNSLTGNFSPPSCVSPFECSPPRISLPSTVSIV